jgi:dipeptidase D
VTCEPAEGIAVKITLDGFTGGHSGVEIHEGHTNAIKAMGRILLALQEPYDYSLISVSGGGKDNAIPRDCSVILDLRDAANAEDFLRAVAAEADKLRGEPNMIPADKTFTCIAEILSETPALCMDDKSTCSVLSLLTLVRNGVLSMSAHVKGLVAHSRNLGIIKTLTDGEGKPTAVKFSMSTRSASNNHLDDSERELETLARALGGEATHRARYPGWDYAPVSPLRDLWTAVSEKLYGITPKVEVIHAGLECGILCDKLGEMDIISVGPDMKDIHTPREMLSIPSVERTYRLVCETIRELA